MNGHDLNGMAMTVIRHLPFLRVRAFLAYASVVSGLFGYSIGRTWFKANIQCNYKDLVQNRILFFGIWEPNLSEIVKARLKEGDTFADLGANIGYYSLMASKFVGSTGRVVAVEPSPITIGLLTDSVRRNAARNIRVAEVAVSDEPRTVELYHGEANNIGSASITRMHGTEPQCTVQALPLHQILTKDEISTLRLIKIDIEGAELPVMKDIVNTIDIYPSTLEILLEVLPNDNVEEWNILLGLLQKKGYNIYAAENDYHPRFYLNRRTNQPLRLIERLHDESLVDLFISKDHFIPFLGAQQIPPIAISTR
jgi:FkbM family methyltransferase